MIPVLFSFGPLHIYSFGALVAAGVFISLKLMTNRALNDGFPKPQEVADLLFISVFAGFLGSRLHYVVQNWDWYSGHLSEILHFWEGGLIFYGGVFASITALVFYMRVKKIPPFKGFDFLFPYLALTHGFGRLGCFLNGCCYGRPCSLPWAVEFPGVSGRVHPAQLYEAALDFLLFLFLNRQYSRKKYDGEILALYFIFYGAIRFFVEIFRADNPVWGSLTYNQWISMGFIGAGLSFHLFSAARARLKG